MVKVWGGMTGAGHKKALKEPHKEWECEQGHPNPGYARRCLSDGCNVWRPDCAPGPVE